MEKRFNFGSEKDKLKTPTEPEISPKTSQTPDRLVDYGEKIIKLFCKNFEVDGAMELRKFKNEHPKDKFIFAASHTNNIDVPAILKTFGHDFDLQVTGNELFFKKAKYIVQNIGVKTLFRDNDNFTKLGQRESSDKSDKREYGVFRPENFIELDEKMEKGRTPWMAAHSFSSDGKMRKVDNGALIEAYRQNAWLIPSAIEVIDGSKRMQGVAELVQNLKSGGGAKYHVGKPYKPDPLPAGLDINIINKVISKRQKGEKVSDQEFADFKTVNHFLSKQSEKLGMTIASMLPEEQRGYYSTSNYNNVFEPPHAIK